MSTAQGDSFATTTPTFVVKINDIKANMLPKGMAKYNVKLIVDGDVRQTTVALRGKAVSWRENIHIDVHNMSMLECQVYARPMIGDETFIGGTKGTIESFLAESTSGVITRKLCKFDVNGNSHELQTTIEFAIVSVDGPAVAAQKQMAEAVAQGNLVFDRMKSIPSSLEHAAGTVDDSIAVFNNVKTIAAVWDPFLDKIRQFTEIVDKVAEIHPYAKIAWAIISATYKVVLAQKERDAAIDHLVEVMNGVYDFVHEAEPLKKIESQKQIVALITQQTTQCAYFIRDYSTNKNFWKRMAKNLISDTKNRIKQYEDKFHDLKLAFQGEAILQTEIIIFRISDSINDIAEEIDLSGILYADGAGFNPQKVCLPHTRETVIDEINQWINSPDGKDVARIFYLSGVAGSGKSTIAHTIAHRYDQLRQLGSSFCFDRGDQTNRRSDNIFSTIARDLADLDPQRKHTLWLTVKENQRLRVTRAPQEQFEKFILMPGKDTNTIGPVVIVIDALDECGDKGSRKVILSILAEAVNNLPSNFRILVTARPESDIEKALASKDHVFCRRMDTIDPKSTNNDICLYFQAELSDIHGLERKWPNKSWCPLLVEKCEGLFQWAFTACRFIEGNEKWGLDPVDQLDILLSSAPSSGRLDVLDKLYFEILERTFPSENITFMNRFRLVLGRILAAREPLSILSLGRLHCDDDSLDVGLIIQPMGSLLSGVTQQHVAVRPLHTSFRDFLTEPKRSKCFFVDISAHHGRLALASMRVMNTELRFNICELKTSYIRNVDVSDLATRVEKAIPPHLSYSCRFWADHLGAATYERKVLEALRYFTDNQFLYWLEVLSLTKQVKLATRMLSLMVNWIKTHGLDIPITIDMSRFVAAYQSIISQSAPHIYLSALPFAPVGSTLSKQYLPQYSRILSVQIGGEHDWPALQNIIIGHTHHVTCVAFSPDGACIVSGSYDKTIRVWDAQTGDIVSGPFTGHTSPVNSVAFSPDAACIVSGSSDRTIRVWDAHTGDMVLGPLRGHTDIVTSVAFSHDAARIVSGSRDKTIRVWDAQTGDRVLDALEGHTDRINCVAFSPDGAHIVSGSCDKTIRVWDAQRGNIVSGPFVGGSSEVNSVQFSPNGAHIVSGCRSGIDIRVWDAHWTGDIVSGPFQGHTNNVKSVVFSPDSTRIVSGSDDRTVRVWDAQTSDIVLDPLKGHTSWVNCVAFSPDGARIISGSADHTIRVWNAQTGVILLDPLEGHTRWVNCVTFSPDGARIVSGSADRTIRVWDAQTGDIVSSPFGGHFGEVNSVAFSPDGAHLVSGCRSGISIWAWGAQMRDTVSQWHTNNVKSVAFSPDSARIVSGSDDQTVQVWDAQTGVIVLDLKGHTRWVNCVAFSPDGAHIVSGSADHTIRVWDAHTGDTVLGPFVEAFGEVNSVAFSPDGAHLVSGSRNGISIRVWDVNMVSNPFQGHTNSVKCVAFSPDGARIVSDSTDQTVRVWDAQTGDIVLALKGHTGDVSCVAFSPDSASIVSGSHDHTIRVWDAHSVSNLSSSVATHTALITSVAISLDGSRIVSGSYDHTIRVWDAQTGDIILGPIEAPDRVRSVAFSLDGTRIVSGMDLTIWVLDAQTGDIILGQLEGQFEGHTWGVGSVAFSPDGTRIASGSDSTVRVWDAQTGDTSNSFVGHTNWIKSVAFSPDGAHIVSGSYDSTIRIWDVQTGDKALDPLEGHTDSVNCVAFSPDGTRIVSGSDDNTIRVWNAQTGDIISSPFVGHTDWIKSVAFSPDGAWVVSGSRDQIIRVWDMQTGNLVSGPFEGHTKLVRSVAFSSDSSRIVSGSDDTTIRVWDPNLHNVVPGGQQHTHTDAGQSLHGAGSDSQQIIHNLPCFENHSKMKNGWILGPHSELLFWVPPSLRDGLWRPSNTTVIAEKPTKIDFKSFVHGDSWHLCKW